MRIVSLVPSATETLFALGLRSEVAAVTHECDLPADALNLPKVTRDVTAPGWGRTSSTARCARRPSRAARSLERLGHALHLHLLPEPPGGVRELRLSR